jgi:hypothetical protein
VSSAVRELAALRDVSLPDLRERLGGVEGQPDARYGRMDGLELLHAPGAHPAIFFFRDGRLVVAHLPDPDLAAGELDELLGEDPPRLRSRAGKHAWALVRAEEGLAVTEEDGQVRYVEVFPPTTFEDYRDRIHTPPPHFVE